MQRAILALVVAAVLATASATGWSAVAVASAAPAERFVQVLYQIEIVDISDRESFRVGIAEAETTIGATPGPGFRILTGPGIIGWAREAVQSLRLEIGHEIESSRRIASPWLAGVLGQTAAMRVVQEEIIVLRDGMGPRTPRSLQRLETGLNVRLTPLRFDAAGEQVLSVVEIQTLAGASQLRTELWTDSAEPRLVAVLEQTGDYTHNGLLRGSEGAHRRYYAVYVTASPVGTSAAGPVVGVGSVRGVGALFWPNAGVSRAGSSVLEFGLGVTPAAGLRLAWRGWVTDRWMLHAASSQAFSPDVRYEIGTDWLLRGNAQDELLLGIHAVRHPTGSSADVRTAVVLSEQLAVSDGLRLGGGYAPLVFSSESNELQSPIWWVSAEYGRRSVLRLSYRHDLDELVQAVLRLPVSDGVSVQIGYDTVRAQNDETVWLGLRWAPGR